MALKDLISSPGHAITGRLAREYRIDPDVHAMLIREIDRAVDDERKACEQMHVRIERLRAALLQIAAVIEVQVDPDIDALHDIARKAILDNQE